MECRAPNLLEKLLSRCACHPPFGTDTPATDGHRTAYIRERAGRDGFSVPYDVRRRQAQCNHGRNVAVRNTHQVFQVLLPDFRPVNGAHEGAADADMLGGFLDRHSQEDEANCCHVGGL